MFVSLKDKEGKTVHTHTSLLNEDQAQRVEKIHRGEGPFVNGFTFLSFYLSMEAVNRVQKLKTMKFAQRAAILGGIVITGRFLAQAAYWRLGGTSQVRSLLDGAPVYEQKYDVPELDKLYFFLDDDNNYEPSLWHHATTKINKPYKLFRAQD
eukprot:TRINITY_DN445_c0_g1_i8.p1 TRINITY_DN445_c0_g1~~TRINITY_DN445_c0_g1_i8.p1  ORF type:complete len:152 (+),score=26.42 TRINITY_DN445_c0_g1_i8:59-514(+)